MAVHNLVHTNLPSTHHKIALLEVAITCMRACVQRSKLRTLSLYNILNIIYGYNEALKLQNLSRRSKHTTHMQVT